jgi:hypothetical protein
MSDLIPIDHAAAVAAAAPDYWSHIDEHEIDAEYLQPLKAKYAHEGKKSGWQAGIRISAGRWRWSRGLYSTREEAENAAREKLNELTKGKMK